MSAHCHDHGCSAPPPADGRYRNVLWVALIVNAAMFLDFIVPRKELKEKVATVLRLFKN